MIYVVKKWWRPQSYRDLVASTPHPPEDVIGDGKRLCCVEDSQVSRARES